MGFFDQFRHKQPHPPERVLASIEKHEGHVELWLGKSRLSIDKLPPDRVEWLSRLSVPLMVEADVETLGDQKRVVALGSVRPHPRLAALRAVADVRHADALQALALLGDAVDDDIELLSAQMRAYFGLSRNTEGEEAFRKVCSHPKAKPSDITEAFEKVPAASVASCTPIFVKRIELLADADAALSCRKIVASAPEQWSPELLLRAFAEVLPGGAGERWDLEDARKILAAVHAITPSNVRVAEAQRRIEETEAKLKAKEKKQAEALLAARPNFDDVEALFSVKLPSHLRKAWEQHYEGNTVGFGFIEAKKGKLFKLVDLSKRLAKDLTDDVRPLPDGIVHAHRLLPFGIGEHDDEFSALDLARPTEDGDYAVVVVFKGRGEGWVTYPSSAAWLESDGLTRYP
jgi:hypothetical protein